MPFSLFYENPVIGGLYSTALVQGSAGGLPIPSAEYLGKYARCSDLFGNKSDLVLCSLYNGIYFWQPVRPLWANTSALNADANIILYPLRTPTILRFTGTMTANRTITPDKTLAYPGLMYQIKMEGALGLFGLNIAGLALGTTLSLLLGGTRTIFFDGTDFQSLT